MKHKVTVHVETKKRFLGIPYTVTEKKHITVDGRTYRQMKRDRQKDAGPSEEEVAACAAIVWKKKWLIYSVNERSRV